MRRKGAVVGVINKLNFKRVMPSRKRVSRAMDGKLHSPPCVLDSGNPYRNDEPVAWVDAVPAQQLAMSGVGLRKDTTQATYFKRFLKKPDRASLHALTAAALVLPGLLSQPAFAAEGDEVDFQYSHYQEGKREIAITGADPNKGSSVTGGKSFNPIEVDSLHGSARVTLTDRVKFAFNYLQDTWGGATPTATVPFLTQGGANQALLANNGTVTGASPNTLGRTVAFDSQLNPLAAVGTDPLTGLAIYEKTADSSKLTHVMATASPETRKQGDFKLSYDWDNAAVSVGGGISIERDYDSRFGNIGGRFDFNQKRTTLNADLSYTNSYTHATRDHDSYVQDMLIPDSQITRNINGDAAWKIMHGTRQDWATHLGLTQVLNKDALVGADFSYTRSTGYLSNPYKGVSVAFIDSDPEAQLNLGAPPGGFIATIDTFYEKRPDVRNQYSVGGRYVQYVNALDAALHFNYQFSADDWGIQAHTFDADWVQPLGNGWAVTPHVRYYSQDAANFYTPYLVSNQSENPPLIDPVRGKAYSANGTGALYFNDNTGSVPIPVDSAGNPVVNPFTGAAVLDAQGKVVTDPNIANSLLPATTTFDRSKLPANYSSDQRLSGFGTLSGGITVAKQFAKGLTLETGFEYYTHQGGLKLGGGGEGAYANFDYWLANAALKVDLEALALRSGSRGNSDHPSHGHHEHGVRAPAGVMFDHMLPAGKFMAGYRFMWNSQSGDMLNGTNAVNDSGLIAGGCVVDPCYLAPSNMTMSMHMLDLMYAPTDWLTLMLMPQFVDMHMEMRGLYDKVIETGLATDLGGHYDHHRQNAHETGGIGDLGMYALFKVFDNGTHHAHATAGFSAPTGDVDIQFRRAHQIDGGFMDYGMQLGSGTWDFKPSLTYTGHIDDLSWGAQANGIVRMEDHNKSGYRLGDLFQATAWGNYNLTNWLTASVRGVYTVQGAIKGQFNGSNGQFFTPEINPDGSQVQSSILKFSPQDYTQNYGGRFWDVGFGLSAMVPGDSLLGGNRVSVEWLQPVHTDYNGYQLDRDGALSATWSVMF
jgi:Protein of unknown function (DUF3570)